MPVDKSWIDYDRLTPEHKKGLKSFIEMCKEHVDEKGNIRCPCIKCNNVGFIQYNKMRYHLRVLGFDRNYTTWTYHGEGPTPQVVDREGWRNVAAEDRNALDEHLKQKFDLAQVEKDVHASNIKGGIKQLIQRRFSDRKNKAKIDFKNVGGYADVDRARNNVPDDMPNENWQKAINHFLTPAHLKRSLTNAACRSQQKYNYRGGTSSYASRCFKEDMSRLEAFYKAHSDKKGNFDSPIAEKEYHALVAEYEASVLNVNEEDGSSSQQPDDVAIFENVLGSRRGHILGIGPKHSSTSPCGFGDQSQTREYPPGFFKAFFKNAEFRDELHNYLASNSTLDPTKFANEDANDEEADDGSGDDMDMM